MSGSNTNDEYKELIQQVNKETTRFFNDNEKFMDINNIENLEIETIFLTKKTSEIGVQRVKEEKANLRAITAEKRQKEEERQKEEAQKKAQEEAAKKATEARIKADTARKGVEAARKEKKPKHKVDARVKTASKLEQEAQIAQVQFQKRMDDRIKDYVETVSGKTISDDDWNTIVQNNSKFEGKTAKEWMSEARGALTSTAARRAEKEEEKTDLTSAGVADLAARIEAEKMANRQSKAEEAESRKRDAEQEKKGLEKEQKELDDWASKKFSSETVLLEKLKEENESGGEGVTRYELLKRLKEEDDEFHELFKAREEEEFREEHKRYTQLENRHKRTPLDYDEWLKQKKAKMEEEAKAAEAAAALTDSDSDPDTDPVSGY